MVMIKYFFLSKRWWVLSVTVLLLVSFLFLFLRTTQSNEGLTYTTKFSFKAEDRVVEVRLESPTNRTVLVEHGVITEVLSFLPSVPTPLLSLPKVTNGLDLLTSKPQKSALTWESTLEESAKYLNFLDSQGYKTLRDVRTSEFIEKVVELDGNKRRIIIFNHTLMVGDLNNDAILPDLKEYLKKYRS
jgi:hypothetical protein